MHIAGYGGNLIMDAEDMVYHSFDMSNPANLVSNNLGGMGPRLSDPPYITMNNVTTNLGEALRLRIFMCPASSGRGPRHLHPREAR